MDSWLDAHLAGHDAAEIWFDGHPATFDAWAKDDPARRALDPRAPDGRLTGVTTNPRLLAAAGASAADAARALRPRFESSGGRAGWVSLQLDPRLADDAAATAAAGRALAAEHPNVLVKVPATAAGFEAVAALTAAGVSTNVTLCTTVTQTRLALEAYGRGRARGSAPPRRAVLSFMVGRLGDACAAAYGGDLRPGDARRLELMALEAHDACVTAAGADVRLVVCSLRRDAADRALAPAPGAAAGWTHVAAGRGRPWIFTCPAPLLAALLEPAAGAVGPVGPADRARLAALPFARAALDPAGLSLADLTTWPPLVANRAEHLAAVTDPGAAR